MKKEKYITLSADKRYLRLQIRKNGKTFSRQYIISEYGTQAKAMRAAIADRDDVLLQIRQGIYAEKSGKTFKEVFDEMPSLFPKRVRTYEKYASLHRCYLSALDDLPIEKVTEEDIMICLNKMVSTASNNTISQTVSMLRFIFRTARIKKYIMINPMDAVIVPKSEHEANHRRATASISELMQVIDGFESTTGQSDQVMFERKIIAYALRLIYYTGVRPAEAFALTRDDVDLVNKVIHVRSELGSSYTENNVVRQTKTTLSTRDIPISNDLMPYLEQVLQMHTYNFIFPRFSGDHFKMQQVQQRINVYCKKNGLHFSMYQLRHQFSTDLLDDDVDPRTIQELMGHEHYSMSIDYARSNHKAKEDAVSRRSTKLHENLHEDFGKMA